MVCPNRLFALDTPQLVTLSYPSLTSAVRYVLDAFGAAPTTRYNLGVWGEVKIMETQQADEDEDERQFDYRFDFILNPLLPFDSSAWQRFVDDWSISDLEAARASKTRFLFQHVPVRVLGYPLIVEVMTASTSGSNKRKRIGIRESFEDTWRSLFSTPPSAIPSNAPGINRRQVWARMASQLIVKSECAKYWGGKGVWLMQDKLLRYIEMTTRIARSVSVPPGILLPLDEVNLVSMKYDPRTLAIPMNGHTRPLVFDRMIAQPIPSAASEGASTVHGILHATFFPSASKLALTLLHGQRTDKPTLKAIITP